MDDRTAAEIRNAALEEAALLMEATGKHIAASDIRAKKNDPAGQASSRCWCQTCRPITLTDLRMVLCPDCGNKRCPHANDHRNACTGSNEPGQPGSAYPAALAAQPAADHLGGPCLTCGDKGAVGNILNAEPCPDCTPSAPLQPAQSAWPRPVADDAMERALTELVEKIVPGLDTGDLLADARTASKALDRAQPAASAEPSKEECWDIWQIAARAEGFLDDRIHRFACDLLDRYGRPAGDAQPVADHKFYPHPGYRAFCQKCGKAETDHPTAPVAAQKADDARDAGEVLAAIESGEWAISKVGPSDGLSDAANAAMAFCAQRIRYPFEGADGARVWFGPSAVAALRKAKATIAQQRKGEGGE